MIKIVIVLEDMLMMVCYRREEYTVSHSEIPVLEQQRINNKTCNTHIKKTRGKSIKY